MFAWDELPLTMSKPAHVPACATGTTSKAATTAAASAMDEIRMMVEIFVAAP